MTAKLEIIEADITSLEVDVIVNAWNRNIIPWWLLLPQGVSGAIKKHGGYQPFRELQKHGSLCVGDAVFTSAGRLPYLGIIHVASINMLWQATHRSISLSTHNAMAVAEERGVSSIAFPVLGSGTGGFSVDKAVSLMHDELTRSPKSIDRVVIVRWKKR